MTPFAVKSGHIPKELYQVFIEMRDKLESLPDLDNGELITCHAVSAAFAERYGLQVIDGTFASLFDHSWITHPNHPKVLIDLYPVGGGSSIIVANTHSLAPWGRLYVAKSITYDRAALDRQKAKLLALM